MYSVFNSIGFVTAVFTYNSTDVAFGSTTRTSRRTTTSCCPLVEKKKKLVVAACQPVDGKTAKGV